MAAVPPSVAKMSTFFADKRPPTISCITYWRTICSLMRSMRGGTG